MVGAELQNCYNALAYVVVVNKDSGFCEWEGLFNNQNNNELQKEIHCKKVVVKNDDLGAINESNGNRPIWLHWQCTC